MFGSFSKVPNFGKVLKSSREASKKIEMKQGLCGHRPFQFDGF